MFGRSLDFENSANSIDSNFGRFGESHSSSSRLGLKDTAAFKTLFREELLQRNFSVSIDEDDELTNQTDSKTVINMTVFDPEHLTRIAEQTGLYDIEDIDDLDERIDNFCEGTRTDCVKFKYFPSF